MSTCATVSRDLDEPIAGTAATARTWLLLEQPGPWGAKALTIEPPGPRTRPRPGERRGGHRRTHRADPPPRPPRRLRTHLPHGRCTRPTPCPETCWLHSATTRDPRAPARPRLRRARQGRPRTFDTVLGGGPTPATRSRSSAPTASATAAARCSAARSPPNWPPPGSRAPGRSPIWADTASPRRCSSCRTATRTAAPRPTPSRRSSTASGKGRIVVGGLPRQLRLGAARTGGRTGRAHGGARVRGGRAERRTQRTALRPRWEVTVAHTDGRRWRVAWPRAPRCRLARRAAALGARLARADGRGGGARTGGTASAALPHGVAVRTRIHRRRRPCTPTAVTIDQEIHVTPPTAHGLAPRTVMGMSPTPPARRLRLGCRGGCSRRSC